MFNSNQALVEHGLMNSSPGQPWRLWAQISLTSAHMRRFRKLARFAPSPFMLCLRESLRWVSMSANGS